jgi:hypothetical protein
LVVPFTIPVTRVSRSPASDSFRGRISGMPPPTAASNRSSTPAASAASNSSFPCADLLVRGHDVLPRRECAQEQRPRRLDATDQLDDAPHGRVVHDGVGVGREPLGGERDVAAPARIADRDAGDLDRGARALGDVGGVLVEQAQGGGPDRPAAEEPDDERRHTHRAITISSS